MRAYQCRNPHLLSCAIRVWFGELVIASRTCGRYTVHIARRGLIVFNSTNVAGIIESPSGLMMLCYIAAAVAAVLCYAMLLRHLCLTASVNISIYLLAISSGIFPYPIS